MQHFKILLNILANRPIAAHIVIGDIYDVNAYVLTWGGTLGFEQFKNLSDKDLLFFCNID